MIKLIPDLPDNVVGISASGEVTANDYETVFIPAIEAALKNHKGVCILYQLGPEFTGFTSGAMWDDMKTGFTHLRAWEKIALVTDHEWLAGAARLFGVVIPCQVTVFSNNEFAEAVRWISAD
jgi:hypothetical protein